MFLYPVGAFRQVRSTNSISRNNISYPNNFTKINSVISDTDTYSFSKKIPHEYKSISFMGRTVHIVDGGNHATNMEHFANAISDDMDTKLHMVDTNPNDKNMKQLGSLEKELHLLNQRENLDGEYVAVPALASVAILNLQDQYNRVMGDDKKLTPENIKANKKALLSFLEKIYTSPYTYSEYIGYMDKNKQGIEHTYGVIQEINSLIAKGAKVYIPSGHPQDLTLKYLAKTRGLNPELYYFISTGKDVGGKIQDLHNEIKDNNWYDFNLLSLSDANVVGVKDTKGAQDYMFAAYDSCITDGARGVYNFSPIRQNGEHIGYSYTDTTTNEYPFNEFPANDEVENLVKFVGRQYSDVAADVEDILKLKQCIKMNMPTNACADKLYPIREIFPDEKIEREKLDLQGDYVDKSLKLFFRKNNKGEVIFPKCDCEGSGKPSVLSMWGSCFAVFNAIARDIKLQNEGVRNKKEMIMIYRGSDMPVTPIDREMIRLRNLLHENGEKQTLTNKQVEEICNEFFLQRDIMFKAKTYFNDYGPWFSLESMNYVYDHFVSALLAQNKKTEAKSILNRQINEIAEHLILSLKETNILWKDLAQVKNHVTYNKEMTNIYDQAKIKWNNASKFERFFMMEPELPIYYSVSPEQERVIESLDLLAKKYNEVADICTKLGEKYPAIVCRCAAVDIAGATDIGESIVMRRKDKVEYIGDLYPDIKNIYE